MIANTWYCIAKTSTFDTGCTINVAFDGYDIQFSASVKFGMSAINITRCNIPYDTVFSLRLREGASQWFVDIFCNKEITPNVTIADSPYWAKVSTTAGEGNVILVLNDISSKYNTEQGGGTGGLDIDQLKSYLDDNGYTEAKNFWSKEGDETIRTRHNIVVDKGGAFGRGSETNITFGRLDNWEDWDASTMMFYTLSASLGVNLNERLKYIEQNGSGLNEDDLRQYLTSNNYLQEADIADLRVTVKGLDDILNGNVGGVIDTWNEVVSFLDGYSQSDDLASILSGMNADIANRVLIENFEKLEGSVTEIAGYFTNGSANNALKLGGQLPSYYATADALNTHITAFNTYKTTTDDRLNKLEALWYMDDEGNVRTTHNIIVEGGGAFGQGTGSGEVPSASVSIKFEGSDVLYNPINGVITLPAYPSAGGGVADSVDWANVANKPTTLGGYGITDALSVNGGTLNGQGAILSLNGYEDSSIHYKVQGVLKTSVGFYNNFSFLADETTGYRIGVNTNGIAQLWNDYNGSVRYDIIHSGNYSSYALPLSGGIISTTNSYYPIRIKCPASFGQTGIRLEVDDTNMGALVSTVDNTYIYNFANSIGLGIYNGVAKFGDNTLIHSGNIGSYKSGSADYISNSTYYYNGNVLTNDVSAYSLFGSIPTDNRMFPAFMQNHPTWSGWADVAHFTGYCMYGATQLATEYNAINPRVAIRKYNQSRSDWGDWTEFITTANIGSQSVSYATSAGNADTLDGYHASIMVKSYIDNTDNFTSFTDRAFFKTGWISGQGDFCSLVVPTWSGNSTNTYYITELRFNLDSANPVIRVTAPSGTSNWYTLARTIDNVASATKLQTGRYLWGNYFNGESDVNGKPLFKVSSADTSINVDIASIIVGPATSNRSGYSSGVGFNGLLGYGGNDNHLHGWIGLNGYYSGAGAETYALVFAVNDNTTYGAVLTERMRIAPNGNVLIGTTEDNGAKLRVNGEALIGAVLIGRDNNAIDGWWRGSEANLYLNYTSKKNIVACYNGGNVIIGAMSDNGAKLQVDGRSYIGNSNVWNHVIRSGVNSQSNNVYALKVIQGTDCGSGLYDTMIITSSDVATLRLSEGDGTQIGICAGDSHGTFTSTHDFRFFTGVATNQPVYSGGGGGFKVGINYEGAALYVSGNFVATGGGAFGSDIRYKDIISYQQLDLETIVKAPLFTFRWNDREDNATHLGTSAQYWLDTQFKDAVNTSNKDFYHLDYGALAVGIGISVGREVKGVKTEVEQLRNKVKDLETKLSKYEQVWHN